MQLLSESKGALIPTAMSMGIRYPRPIQRVWQHSNVHVSYEALRALAFLGLVICITSTSVLATERMAIPVVA